MSCVYAKDRTISHRTESNCHAFVVVVVVICEIFFLLSPLNSFCFYFVVVVFFQLIWLPNNFRNPCRYYAQSATLNGLIEPFDWNGWASILLRRCNKFSFYDATDSQNKVIYCCDVFMHLFGEACASMRVRMVIRKRSHKFEQINREFFTVLSRTTSRKKRNF